MSEELQNQSEAGGESLNEGFNDAPAEGAELNTVDDIMAAFEQGEEQGAVEGEADADENAEGDTAAEGTEEQKGEELPDVPMPDGFDETMWGTLTPEVRSALDAREKAHAEAIAKSTAEVQQIKADTNAFAINANAQIQQALATMKTIVEGEYHGIDWQALAQSNPAEYVRLQQGAAQRQQAIARIQQALTAATQQYEAQQQAEARAAIQNEFATVLPEIKALVGNGFERSQFATQLQEYMTKEGCPQNVINGLTKGYELKMVAKAMLYDRLQAQRAEAAKKVAEAPKVQAPHGAPVSADGDGRLKRARAILKNNPNSTEALASVFANM